jgi:hypothetical protein
MWVNGAKNKYSRSVITTVMHESKVRYARKSLVPMVANSTWKKGGECNPHRRSSDAKEGSNALVQIVVSAGNLHSQIPMRTRRTYTCCTISRSTAVSADTNAFNTLHCEFIMFPLEDRISDS